MTEKKRTRDEKGRFVSPVNGQPVPDSPASRASRFKKGDSRASKAGIASGASRREKADLRRLCQAWLETDVDKDRNGNPITGGQKMVLVAAREIGKGNPRFWELLRDTAGFKPVDKVMVADVDPAVIAEVESMVQEEADK